MDEQQQPKKKQTLSLTAVILLIVLTAFVTFVSTYMAALHGAQSRFEKKYGVVDEIDALVEQYYIGNIDRAQIEEWVAKGYMQGLGDKYGYYMTKEEFEEDTANMNGDGAGIGIKVTYNEEEHLLEIFNVIKGGPAEKAGIEAGDVIYKVNGTELSTLPYEEAIAAFKAPEGTMLTVGVLRGSEELEFKVTTAKYKVNSVEYRMFTGESAKKTGVIRIFEFALETGQEFKTAVDALVDAGAEQLVFDLRNNHGGILDSVTEMLDYLLPEGPIVRITDSKGKVIETFKSDAEHKCDLPMAVLTNGETASASELFISTLKDYGKVFTVGTETFGKGTVLSVIPLSNGGALVLSTHLFCPPYSDNFEGNGIDADVELEIPEGTNIYKLDDSTDIQLIRAVSELNAGRKGSN